MMDAPQRRRELKQVIEYAQSPLSASALAKRLHVSRQVIVGDVALLRAEGANIISTARGYLSGDKVYGSRHTMKLACRHTGPDTRDELYTIVDMGGQVLSVSIEHAAYGELTGQLGLTCRKEVDDFIDRLQSGDSRPLSELTGGVHLHTIAAQDPTALEAIKSALSQKGYLYPESD